MDADRAREVLERWPGYTEQSWCERFAELDRQYNAQSAALTNALQSLTSQAHAAGRTEVFEEWASFHDTMAEEAAVRQASAELSGADSLMTDALNRRRLTHEKAATAIRARITTPTGGKA